MTSNIEKLTNWRHIVLYWRQRAALDKRKQYFLVVSFSGIRVADKRMTLQSFVVALFWSNMPSLLLRLWYEIIALYYLLIAISIS